MPDDFLWTVALSLQNRTQLIWPPGLYLHCSSWILMWFKGPDFLYKLPEPETHELFDLIYPEMDVEVWPQLTILATHVETRKLPSECFQHFSTWDSLLRAISLEIHQALSYRSGPTDASQHMCKGWTSCCQETGKVYPPSLCNMPQAQKEDRGAEDRWPPSRVARHISTFHLCGAGRIWTMDSGQSTHSRRCSSQQKMGHSVQIYKHQGVPMKVTEAYHQLHQHTAKILCS